ncbi:hypothetical protein HHK36_030765 [Tetracentron sinense]|uniref:NAB domain-containing protein n=1 Tax=Tetracentron sinense TaxID=13715 RepID=A0A834Y9W6_TETSI|nr:hypothetical protein HHK36_030765 [Tetracentron sinense]
MLQRAASNAYSWWWASHVRTKQSKWLEQNLQDMEQKVKCMLKLIEEDGDSFAKRAEMYYRKRPELINFVEESYRAYRALAERYDHISGELQNANHTIATVFPEQVQFAMDEEDETNSPKIFAPPLNPGKVPKSYIPKVPEIPKKDALIKPILITKKVQPKKITTSAITRSGMSKPEALEEIDKLQKGILVLQTEKEFVKSSYESGLAKYWEIEKRVTEMQGKVCSLQDEFSVVMAIEDDEARTLMAATALKSCQETLIQLQEKREQSAEEAQVEYQRIKDAYEKLETFKNENLQNQIDPQKLSEKEESVSAAPNSEKLDQEVGKTKQEGHELELLRENIREHLKVNSSTSLTVTELAEKIDELVNKVISLETSVSSQTALIKRLKSETDELQAHLQNLEEDKGTMIDGSSMKLRELEEKLCRIQDLNRSAEDQNNNLQTHFTEAHCNLDHLSEKLQSVKPELETEITGSFQEVGVDVEPQKDFDERKEMLTPGDGAMIFRDTRTEVEEEKTEVQDLRICSEDQEDLSQSKPSNNHDDLSENLQDPKQQDKVEEQDPSQTVNSSLNIEPKEQPKEEEDQPNWQQLFLNGLEDREKILLAEYTSILRNYKGVKKQLSEVEKKNQDSLFEITMQLRELKNANTMKNEEIQSLRQKLSFLQTSCDENLDTNLTKSRDSHKGLPYDSMAEGSSSQYLNTPYVNSDDQPVLDLLDEQNVELTARTDETTVAGTTEISLTEEEEEEEIKVVLIDEPHAVSTFAEKFRADIDELLEENLEFWLRFSTSFHQIQKFQTTIQDLQVELSKLKGNKKEEGSTPIDESIKSDARPIYKHLREIQTELTVWLEQSALLKDELQFRFSSLCNIQEEISRVLKAGSGSGTEEAQFTSYQAAKFQGEVLNMQQENNKVADELQEGLDHVRGLQVEIETTLSKLKDDLGLSGSRNHHSHGKHSSRSRVPLRSFLFGIRPKKQKPSIFSCMNPALQKQYSDLRAGLPM